MKKLIACILTVCFVAFSILAYGYSVHPDEQLSQVKTNVALGVEPWASAYQQLKSTALSTVSTGVPAEFQIPRDDAILAEQHKSILSNNAQIAYWNALRYRLDGYTTSASKVVTILNAWSAGNTSMKWTDADSTKLYDTQLVASTTVTGLVYAAELIEGYSGWTQTYQNNFKSWIQNVVLPCVNGARTRTNNWASWACYASAVMNDYIGNNSGFDANTTYLRKNIDSQIDAQGRMPEELKRDMDASGNSYNTNEMNGFKGLWYTYYSLAPMTAHAQLVYNKTGENLFLYQSADDAGSIKKALDCFLAYVKAPVAYCWKFGDSAYTSLDETMLPYPSSIWPSNLFEAMASVYQDMDYYDYIGDDTNRPVIYTKHRLGFAWMFPTLLKYSYNNNPFTAKMQYVQLDGATHAVVQIVNNSTDLTRQLLFITAAYENGQLKWVTSQTVPLADGLKHTVRQATQDGMTTKSFLIDAKRFSPIITAETKK